MSEKQLLTHSRMASFKACRRRHFLAYEVGFRKEIEAKALRMGTAFHEAVDILKTTGELEAAIAACSACYEYVPDMVDQGEWEIERETVESLVTGYEWRWANMPLEVLASEHTFQLPLVNPETGKASTNWALAGKIDGIVKLEDGRLAVLEHKLVSDPLDLDGDFWRRLQLDHQITLYVYVARQLGYAVETVLYDVVRKPTIRANDVPVLDELGRKIVLDADGNRVWNKPKKKDGPSEPRQIASVAEGHTMVKRPMTSQEWSEKLLDSIFDEPLNYYARWEIARLDSDLEEFQAEMWDIQQTMRDAQLRNRWYKTVSRDTCNWCSYFGLCSSRYDRWNETPDGFISVTDIHPELEETTNV